MLAEQLVRIELDADSLSRGYASMGDAAVADDMNTAYRTVYVAVSASQIMEAINAGAWGQLTADERKDVDVLLSLGDEINIAPGTRTRTMLHTIFAGSQPTVNAINELGITVISRADELGVGVSYQLVSRARGLEP